MSDERWLWRWDCASWLSFTQNMRIWKLQCEKSFHFFVASHFFILLHDNFRCFVWPTIFPIVNVTLIILRRDLTTVLMFVVLWLYSSCLRKSLSLSEYDCQLEDNFAGFIRVFMHPHFSWYFSHIIKDLRNLNRKMILSTASSTWSSKCNCSGYYANETFCQRSRKSQISPQIRFFTNYNAGERNVVQHFPITHYSLIGSENSTSRLKIVLFLISSIKVRRSISVYELN